MKNQFSGIEEKEDEEGRTPEKGEETGASEESYWDYGSVFALVSQLHSDCPIHQPAPVELYSFQIMFSVLAQSEPNSFWKSFLILKKSDKKKVDSLFFEKFSDWIFIHFIGYSSNENF